MTITFRKIDASNYKNAISLKVNENQADFVAPNWFSILEANYESDEKHPYAIYNDEDLVGFFMYCFYPADEDYPRDSWWLERYMIGKDFQGRCYGKKALKQFLKYFFEKYKVNDILISAVPENYLALTLYEQVGFMRTGEYVGKEIVLELSYSRFKK
ncbi:GNAT family N-acetyltransferase [Oceanobacillus kimchii]|uniref:GNAT family N-acetyltransferase n=1 Tax=Oceanobacillus kimchii TaxID=746691 RepID=UPI0009841811|nr:GNAT family N-acetyltransferase [Oceanobacillus kimchii]